MPKYPIKCPHDGCRRITATDEYILTDHASGVGFRCHEHKNGQYFGHRADAKTIIKAQRPHPTSQVQKQARQARLEREANERHQATVNRMQSAVTALTHFGEAALHRPGVSDEDRRLMKEILDRGREGTQRHYLNHNQ